MESGEGGGHLPKTEYAYIVTCRNMEVVPLPKSLAVNGMPGV